MSTPETETDTPYSRPYVYYRHGAGDGLVSEPDEFDALQEDLVAAIGTAVERAGADGVVVAMSGGVDSTVTAALAVEALGGERVLGLSLPCHKTDTTTERDTRTVAEALGIDYRRVHLRPLLEAFEDRAAPTLEPDAADRVRDPAFEGRGEPDRTTDGVNPSPGPNDERAIGNAVARLRALCSYYAANRGSRLVLGTANRSELLLGYLTKYGDGAADAFPIGDCYKTEVRALADHLGLPRRIVTREPTAGFYAGQTDAADLGAPYRVIDPFLHRYVDLGESVAAAAAAVEMDPALARNLAARYRESAHKRTTPPTPGLGLGRQ